MSSKNEIYAHGSFLQIDLKSFAANLRQIQSYVGRKTGIILVVKSDAYGHGIAGISRRAESEGVQMLAVAKPEEAMALRESGIRIPILLMGSCHSSLIKNMISERITLTVSSIEEARRIRAAAKKTGRSAEVHFKVDTGMGRFGLKSEDALKALFEIRKYNHIHVRGLFSHFPDSSKPSDRLTNRQISTMMMLKSLFDELYPDTILMTHISNSSGVINYPVSGFSHVRIGLMAYGINPCSSRKAALSLKPVMSWKSYVSSIKTFESGSTISYGRAYKTKRKTRIAVVPVGYASGYPLACSGSAQVIIGGKKYPVVGRVTMDFIMVDIGMRSAVDLWDDVTLIGRTDRQQITVEDLAKQSGTIPYEISCRLDSRLPRVTGRVKML